MPAEPQTQAADPGAAVPRLPANTTGEAACCAQYAVIDLGAVPLAGVDAAKISASVLCNFHGGHDTVAHVQPLRTVSSARFSVDGGDLVLHPESRTPPARAPSRRSSGSSPELQSELPMASASRFRPRHLSFNSQAAG